LAPLILMMPCNPSPASASGNFIRAKVKLITVKDEGPEIQQEFSTMSEALIRRGFEAYELPKGLIFRIRRTSALVDDLRPEIDELTQARHVSETEDMARSLIAVSTETPIADVGVRVVKKS
jgi:hypothetical protein